MLGIRIAEFDSDDNFGKDIHTYKDWGLKWVEPYTIDYPEPDERIIEVPGSYAPLDVTELITGHVGFKRRPFTFNFEVPDKDYYEYEKIKSKIAKFIHGKRLRLYLDTDPDYFYLARIQVAFDKSEKDTSTLTITGEADAYKYNATSSMTEWLWDPFDFEEDTIGYAGKMPVKGTFTLKLAPTQIPVSPTFTCTAPLTVTYRGYTGTLGVGETYDPNIILRDDDLNILVFSGYGDVGVEYRGGSL